ncbi:MAG: response regulator, partial [Candidatus Sumerlaeota bacterium]|nr:response regulator [Candidatus Sumerlaeota bacterium]
MRNLRVLIVDDDPDFSSSLSILFRAMRYDVDTAFSGEEAFGKYRQRDYDVAFLDYKLPGMNGVESFRRIRTLRPDTRIVMMTGYSLKEMMAPDVKDDAWAILRKPFQFEDAMNLVSRIRPVSVLLADADAEFATQLKEALEWNGYRVEVALTARQTLARAKSNGVDLIVLDTLLPDDGAVEVWRTLKRSGLKKDPEELAKFLGVCRKAREDERLEHIRIEGGGGRPMATILV